MTTRRVPDGPERTVGNGYMWLKNCWQVAAFAAQIGERPLARCLLNEPILMFRLQNGRAVALQDRCPHRLVPLSLGKRVGDEIQCGYHGLRFAADGRCTHIPGQSDIPTNFRATRYPLVERQGLVWIWLGAPELAAETLIPAFPWMDHPQWRQSPGYHHFKCDYRLMTDNLLDLGHETYLHQHSIGNQESQDIAEYPLSISLDQGVVLRAHREMPNIDPPPFFQLFLNTTERIDRWQTAVYMPPGVNMTEAGAYVRGTPRAQAPINRIMHLLTPETQTSSHYFWCVSRNYRLSEPDLGQAIRDSVSGTFDEDRVMLEIQQTILGKNSELRVPQFATKLDAAPIRARRMLQKLCTAESSQKDFVSPVIPLVADESTTPAMLAR